MKLFNEGSIADRLWTPGVDASDYGTSRFRQLYEAEQSYYDDCVVYHEGPLDVAPDGDTGMKKGSTFGRQADELRRILSSDPAEWSREDAWEVTDMVTMLQARLLEREASRGAL